MLVSLAAYSSLAQLNTPHRNPKLSLLKRYTKEQLDVKCKYATVLKWVAVLWPRPYPMPNRMATNFATKLAVGQSIAQNVCFLFLEKVSKTQPD